MAANILQQAINAIQGGDISQGRQLLARAVQANPLDEHAWLWLASVHEDPDQRRACLQRVLSLNPDNEIAQRTLAQLDPSHRAGNVPPIDEPVTKPTTATPVGRAVPGGMPTWKEQDKRRAMRWLSILLAVLVVAAWGLIIGWVILSPAPVEATPAVPASDTSLFVILAPILVAAAAIERVLEATFGLIENNARALVAYLGRGLRWLKSAEILVQESRQRVADLTGQYSEAVRRTIASSSNPRQASVGEPADILQNARMMLDQGEQQLAEAERNLALLTSAPSYKSAKAAASIVVGMMLGVLVAMTTGLQMFALLGLAGVPAKIDAFVTGLAMGTGAYPVHSLVGILQQFKDLLSSAQTTLSRRNGGARDGNAASPVSRTGT